MNTRCWMMPRYMSTTYSVPSGAVVVNTGRDRTSVDARKLGRSSPTRADSIPDESSRTTKRSTRFPAGSVMKTLSRNSGGSRSPTYAVGLDAEVKRLSVVSARSTCG